jgi:mannose-1-phosphate guanylyltransferase
LLILLEEVPIMATIHPFPGRPDFSSAIVPEQHLPGNFWAVIPAGGSGTRLWPVSRAGTPKFLLPLIQDRRSLLQQTADRLRLVADPGHMLVVCGEAHADRIAAQLPELDASSQIVVEPSPRGTGPAIALAAALIERIDPTAIMGSFASDHAVGDLAAFRDAVTSAIATAAAGWLVTIGLRPSRPETGYGYIARGDDVMMETPAGVVYAATEFVEKPDLETAMLYMQSGRYYWNASMFVWQVSTIMEELRTFLPDVAEGVTRIAEAWGTEWQEAVVQEVWPQLPDISIDNGVMELSKRVAVVPAEMGWSDIGDWHGLGALLAQDEAGNCFRGDAISTGCVDSVIWSDTGRMISVIGLDNIVVVDTADALLVADRRQAQMVRTTVSRLKELHRTNLY